MDVKDTKEALIGVNEVALYFAKALSDGVQIRDFTGFWEKLKDDPAFHAKLQAAWEGHQNIAPEVKDVDLTEGLELATIQLDYLPKFIEAMKKPEPAAAVEAQAEAELAKPT